MHSVDTAARHSLYAEGNDGLLTVLRKTDAKYTQSENQEKGKQLISNDRYHQYMKASCQVLTFRGRNYFLILAHSVYKM